MYMSVSQAALQWGISERRVRILCAEGRVDGVIRNGWAWNIPLDASKPGDGRQLRHLKNDDLRVGSINLSALEKAQEEFLTLQKDSEFVMRMYRQAAFRFTLSTFVYEGLDLGHEDLALLFSGCFSSSVSFDTQLLALNTRSILLRLVQESGLGPVGGGVRHTPFYTENRLLQLYRTLLQGIDDEAGSYRRVEASEQRPLSVKTSMEILLTQYEREWSALHPLVRALFLFGELLRIRPFGRYDAIFASLALAGELLNSGFPPVFVDVSMLDEFKAALLLTRTRGNYQNTLRMLEQSLQYEFALLLRKESST